MSVIKKMHYNSVHCSLSNPRSTVWVIFCYSGSHSLKNFQIFTLTFFQY